MTWPLTGTFKGGNSQHPIDGVTKGERLIEATYEAIRYSPHWNTSLLIITWDEHGGFYNHVSPSRRRSVRRHLAACKIQTSMASPSINTAFGFPP